jgi:hypothetical protein
MILIAAGCAWSSQTKVGWKFLVLFGLILLSYPVVCARSTFLVTKPANALIADSQQHSPRQVMQKNPIAEFVVTNAVTLNLAGMISVVQCIREKSWRYKAIIAEFFGPLIAFSMVLLLMWSAQPGPAWRDICVWGMLMLPFTARLLAGDSWFLSRGRIRTLLTVVSIVLVLG